MTAYNVISPSSLVAGQPEDISVVLANLNAISGIINGNLDNSNVSAVAAIAISKLAGYPTDGTKYLAGDSTWKVVAAGFAGPGTPATTLPASPTDGQQAILTDNITTPTYAWLFQWSQTATKWFFIGGSPWAGEVDADETSSTNGFLDLTTVGPTFTIPRAGRYIYQFTAETQQAAVGNNCVTGMKLGAGGLGTTDVTTISGTGTNFATTHTLGPAARTAAASDVWKMQYNSTGATCHWRHRRLSIIPVYVT
jgi:hypothetical protein